jgi:hypothetical protein
MKPLAALALVALAAGAQAQITKSGSGYLLRVKYTKGSTLKYVSTNTASGMPGQSTTFKVTMPIVMQITDLNDQIATMKMTIGPASVGGSEMNQAQTVTLELDNRNQPAKGGPSPGNVGAALPAKPIKIGSTWTSIAPVATGAGTQKLEATYKFRGLKKVGSTSVAEITYTLKGAATGSGTLRLLAKDGTIFSNQMRMSTSVQGNSLKLLSVMKRS